MEQFFNCEPEELDIAPFDIETTGFTADSIITTIIMYHDDSYHIWLNVDGDDDVSVEDVRQSVISQSGFENCLLYVCENEASLLENLRDYVSEAFTDETLLVAFNGETRRGGFDLPFIRRRCFEIAASKPFDGVWFTDPYEVLSNHGYINTTVPDEPRLEGMKKSDLEQFVDDTGLDVSYSSMRKSQIVRALESHNDVTEEGIASWSNKNDEDEVQAIDSYTSSTLKDYIDDKSLNISYNKMNKDTLVSAIRQSEYTEAMLREWHEETGRDIGRRELKKLDETHEHMFERKFDNEDWIQRTPYDVEVFEPFDPYDDSGVAVTEYMNGNYVSVILHCLADVAKTVNITRAMLDLLPQNAYKPSIL